MQSATDKLDFLPRQPLAFAAFFAGLDTTDVPLFIFKVCGAEQALAAAAEDGRSFVAGFVQRGNGFAGSLGLLLAERFPCRLRFHEAPLWADCTLRAEIGKREK